MKLNPDCIRDVLLAVEDTTDYYNRFEYTCGETVHTLVKKYTHDEIVYHIHQGRMSGLFYQCYIHGNGAHITIDDLSPEGHAFLANTRQNPIWQAVKDAASEIGTESLTALMEIAKLSVIQVIRKHFGIA